MDHFQGTVSNRYYLHSRQQLIPSTKFERVLVYGMALDWVRIPFYFVSLV